MENNRYETRRRIGRGMFLIAAALIAISLSLAAFQACENSRATGEPIINIQIG